MGEEEIKEEKGPLTGLICAEHGARLNGAGGSPRAPLWVSSPLESISARWRALQAFH